MDENFRQREFAAQLAAAQRRLFTYIFSQMSNLEETHEVYQQTCLVLWQKFGDFTPGTSFAAWACAVARNVMRDHLKKQRRYRARFSNAFQERLAEMLVTIPPAELDDRETALRACLQKLPEDRRTLVESCYCGQKSVAEVAEDMGRSTRGLYGTLRKIREWLLRCIDRELGGEGHP